MSLTRLRLLNGHMWDGFDKLFSSSPRNIENTHVPGAVKCFPDRETCIVSAQTSASVCWKRRITITTVQTFQDLLSERPFRPFRLVMSSGQTYEVRHPEMAMLTRTDILVGTDVADDGVPAEFKICSLLRVTAIEPLDGATAQESSLGND